MPLPIDRLREINQQLLSRPGHEKVRSLVYQLLTEELRIPDTEIAFEETLPEVRGRADALIGRTVFEFKRDLRKEEAEAREELTRYLADRERATGERFIGIATDGAKFMPFELRSGQLRELPSFEPRTDTPRDIVLWLESAVAMSAELAPDAETVRRALGRGSLAWHIARADLEALWDEVSGHPDVRLKRELWASLLERVYGAPVDDDTLFFQHTYLSVVAKTVALHVLGLPMPQPTDLLAGTPFRQAGIQGAVESDFFDWLLAAAGGPDLVRRIAAQSARLRLRDVQCDVLKSLYESLIDPEQRHDLGEYYTPDWLAARMCEEAIERPLEQRILDPACGSGTFLFHAVRRLLAAADAARIPGPEAVKIACNNVRGVDVHPVAVQIARVTFLLALGQDLLSRHSDVTVPVYIGDSLQWNTHGFLTARELEIRVPEGDITLLFPFSVAQDPALFDSVIERMLQLSERSAEAGALETWLKAQHRIDGKDLRTLVETYSRLRELHSAGRNHIWGFVARNLARPIWLSGHDQRSDVVIGNPPWLAYRFMSAQTQAAFRKECRDRGLWAGGKVATHQDLSAYFFVRSLELYLKEDGLIAFVMPYAAMSRRQFQGFRTRAFGGRGSRRGEPTHFARFTHAWAFPDVQPLFPVPSCVLFARRRSAGEKAPVLPSSVLEAGGNLRRRDATPDEAAQDLTWREGPWPAEALDLNGSPYRGAFRQGATMVPRLLCLVEYEQGPLGVNPESPLVRSRRSAQEKRPWKGLPALRHNVESQFLRPLYLGESIAPFRLLTPVTAVVPWLDGVGLVDSASALHRGYMHLHDWLKEAEELWNRHGRSRMSLLEQFDYYGKLTAQLPPPPLRVVYAASGTWPAAAILRAREALADTKIYWAPADSVDEARYLVAVLNSETARRRVASLQSRGQWGARDFHKVMLDLPIPRFDPRDPLHKRLAKAGAHAERVAASVELRDGEHFTRARRRIRDALAADGVAVEIDRLVAALLA